MWDDFRVGNLERLHIMHSTSDVKEEQVPIGVLCSSTPNRVSLFLRGKGGVTCGCLQPNVCLPVNQTHM